MRLHHYKWCVFSFKGVINSIFKDQSTGKCWMLSLKQNLSNFAQFAAFLISFWTLPICSSFGDLDVISRLQQCLKSQIKVVFSDESFYQLHTCFFFRSLLQQDCVNLTRYICVLQFSLSDSEYNCIFWRDLFSWCILFFSYTYRP